jgi:hypothetical protein
MNKLNTKKRYLDAMIWIFKQEQFTNNQFMEHFDVSKSLVYNMRKLGFIKKLNKGTYKWALEFEPTLVQVNALRKVSNYHNQIRKQTQKQLTIASVRKTPIPTPIPVVHEAECDNSNSKMLLIMAIGAVIGFMIATAIWK